MIIDCDTCRARGPHCQDCVVTFLLGQPGRVQLDREERRALTVLADSGMVPPLRMVPIHSSPVHSARVPCAQVPATLEAAGDAQAG